jgi:tRNA modification GTPase
MGPALRAAQQLRSEIAAALAGAGQGERLREGLVVAIAGPPNAGKSTLLNRLARREAAIVSPYAGTTRDVIEVHLNLAGYPVTLVDTAGIRESAEPIEQEGVRRARERAAAADVVLWVIDASADDRGAAKPNLDAGMIWLVENKIDAILAESRVKNCGEGSRPRDEYKIIVSLSALTGQGFDILVERLAQFARDFFVGAESAIVTRHRHRELLQATVAALDRAVTEGGKADPREELVAEDLRAAATALGRLIGRVDVEDILDVIFRDFCIGK